MLIQRICKFKYEFIFDLLNKTASNSNIELFFNLANKSYLNAIQGNLRNQSNAAKQEDIIPFFDK